MYYSDARVLYMRRSNFPRLRLAGPLAGLLQGTGVLLPRGRSAILGLPQECPSAIYANAKQRRSRATLALTPPRPLRRS